MEIQCRMIRSMEKQANSKNYFNLAIYITGIIIILIIWSILSVVKNNFLFPNLIQITNSLAILLCESKTYIMILNTIGRIIISLSISYVISLIILMIYHFYKPSINLFRPCLTIMKSMPLIIITLFIWLVMPVYNGIYVICVFMILPLIIEALISGYDSIDSEVNDYLKLDTNDSFISFVCVKLPLLKNNLLLSLFQTLGLSFKVMIMSEYIFNLKNSIGKDLSNIKANLQMDYLLAWAIIIIILVTAIEYILNKLKKRIN